jgi:phosphoribosylanthranilate isomerase
VVSSSPKTQVKVCCIASREEARQAVGLGANLVGLIAAHEGVSTGLTDAVWQQTLDWVPPGVGRVLLTPFLTADEIVAHAVRVGTRVIQICDHVDPSVHKAIRAAKPDLHLMQVVHVMGVASVKLACALAPSSDALLLDSGQPGADFSELGGTGRTHDWHISRAIVDAVSVPVWLAGGLCPENVGRAIQTVRPHGVDLCSGVRTHGCLDEHKLRRFMSALDQG